MFGRLSKEDLATTHNVKVTFLGTSWESCLIFTRPKYCGLIVISRGFGPTAELAIENMWKNWKGNPRSDAK